jgi:hypothetical protein
MSASGNLRPEVQDRELLGQKFRIVNFKDSTIYTTCVVPRSGDVGLIDWSQSNHNLWMNYSRVIVWQTICTIRWCRSIQTMQLDPFGEWAIV